MNQLSGCAWSNGNPGGNEFQAKICTHFDEVQKKVDCLPSEFFLHLSAWKLITSNETGLILGFSLLSIRWDGNIVYIYSYICILNETSDLIKSKWKRIVDMAFRQQLPQGSHCLRYNTVCLLWLHLCTGRHELPNHSMSWSVIRTIYFDHWMFDLHMSALNTVKSLKCYVPKEHTPQMEAMIFSLEKKRETPSLSASLMFPYNYYTLNITDIPNQKH